MNATDYAHIHFAYHEDPELSFIADTLQDEYGAGYLVWLYWPRLIAVAKSARTFGWMRFTARKLAASVHDTLTENGGWAARERMFQMMLDADLLRVRQDDEALTPSAQVDVLLVKYPSWQRMSPAEKSKLSRERKKVADGRPVDWTVRHLDEFAFTSPEGNAVTENDPIVTGNGTIVTANMVAVTTLEETKRDETKEGPRGRALPPTVLNTIEMVRSIPGLSRRSLESNVRKAMEQYPSLPDDAVCEAITAFEASIPEGKAINSMRAWSKMRNCFEIARQRNVEASNKVEPGGPIDHTQSITSLQRFLSERETA